MNSLFLIRDSILQDSRRRPPKIHWPRSLVLPSVRPNLSPHIPETQDKRNPVRNQYYFVDAGDAFERRTTFLEAQHIRRNTLSVLETMPREVNPYVWSHATIKEVIDCIQIDDVIVDNIVLSFKQNIGLHLRIHHL